MNTALMQSTSASSAANGALREPRPRRTRRPRAAGGAHLDVGRSPAAKRMAAAILEVLAGARTPSEAARILGLSLPRYYQVETRALNGLLAACESKPKGRQPNPANEAIGLRQENERLKREITRHQALTRAAQRAIGLPSSPPPAAKTGKPGANGSNGAPAKKTRRRRMARALSVAQRLQKDNPFVAPAASAHAAPAAAPSV
jgi:hypothetical protein